MNTVIVAAAILIEDGRVLLTQRKAGGHLAGAWEFPGGKVELGEDPKEALARELHEEVGIFVRVGEIVDVTFHRYDDANKAVLLLFYEVERTAPSPAPQAIDVAALKWGDEGDLDPAQFPPADVAILSKVRRRLGAKG
ncbi:(deoxy)nucleoside triphosphate pyrophosphohydrolase [Pendulispora albinea]|uniref:8-oxo-dGTP diphosphatase n=1 Tax=Pendulispora albinea TaxID=2741071 RepID=A0ABZ2LP45_9BACT